MDMDKEVDVFHAVKMIRINRPQLIDMKDEYKYLYDVMLHWYMTNSEYRILEPEESKKLDTEIIEDDESEEEEPQPENQSAFSRLQRSFRRASSRSRANSALPTPIQTPTPRLTPTPILPPPNPQPLTNNSTPTPSPNPTSNNLHANSTRSSSKSPRPTVYLND
jgi:hypothetical protein